MQAMIDELAKQAEESLGQVSSALLRMNRSIQASSEYKIRCENGKLCGDRTGRNRKERNSWIRKL